MPRRAFTPATLNLAEPSRLPADSRGYDAGKKVNGRKRFIITDALGLLLRVLVVPANV